MTPRAPDPEQHDGITSALHRADLTVNELWLRYFALGGVAGLMELEAYLHGLLTLPVGQRDVLAHAVNERLTELGALRPAPYSFPMRAATPQHGPLTALVELLRGAHLAPPEDLPVIAAAAGRAMGVGIGVYLVDYGQRELILLALPGRPDDRITLGIDSTLAGRAFRNVEVLPSDAGDRPRLWVPLLDGAERRGVLEVVVDSTRDLFDPLLRDQLGWVASELSHLVAAMSATGDALDAARLTTPRTPEAELIWSLLPPLSAGTGRFSIAGLLEPSSEVGGDTFDYAVATRSITLAIYDGMGHGLAAGLMASAALAASRTARRAGHDLLEQADGIDRVLSSHFPDALLTGVLAELDLTSGRLRYLVAGHPPPLLLRRGRVVKTLTGGRRTPFGLPTGAVALGEESLEPGDTLLLHTDGVTEARDARGVFFGEDRLVGFLEREAASGHPPAETVRRLLHAVLAHQDGLLQDDATVLLARWDTGTLPGSPSDGPALSLPRT